MNRKIIVLLGIASICSLFGVETLQPLPFLHLDNKAQRPIVEQINENSALVGGYYSGMDLKDIPSKKGRFKKVYNPCEIGLCGMKTFQGKYYTQDEVVTFAGREYSPFFSIKEGKLESMLLFRKVPRKEYSIFGVRKDTVFSFFYDKTNLLKSEFNAPFYLRSCYNGKNYIGEKAYSDVYKMYTACDRLFAKNAKKTNYTVEKNYQEIFFIEERGGLDEDSLIHKVEERSVPYPFKRDFTVSLVCSPFNYCIELVEVKNSYSRFVEDNFMVYENNLLIKDLDILATLDKERSKIHCERNHKEEGLAKAEIEDRLLCDLRHKIFNENILYVLKVDQYNRKHLDFTGIIKYRNLYKTIQEKRELLNSEKFVYTDYQKRELELEIREYEYLLSLVGVYKPQSSRGAYRVPTNEEIIGKKYDTAMIKRQIEHAKEMVEQYKKERLQYKIDEEYTRIQELKRILFLQY